MSLEAKVVLNYLAPITVGATSQDVTIPTGAAAAVFEVAGAIIMVRMDGTAPTASTGIPWYPRDRRVIESATELGQMKVIRQGSVSATLYGEFYRDRRQGES